MAVTWITPVDVTPTLGTSFVDVDISAHTDGTAKAAILHFEKTSGNAVNFALRMNGSTDLRINPPRTVRVHQWHIVGLDADEIFEARMEAASNHTITLVGYFSGTTDSFWFDNRITANGGTRGSWNNVDFTASLDQAGQIPLAIACELYNTDSGTGDRRCEIRKDGSTDDLGSGNNAVDIRWQGFDVCGVAHVGGAPDTNIFEEFREAASTTEVWISGYIMEDVEFLTNVVERTVTADGTWRNMTALPNHTVDERVATGGAYKVSNSDGQAGVDDNVGLRRDGSIGETDTISGFEQHSCALIEATSSIVEANLTATTIAQVWERGVFFALAEVEAPPVVAFQSTLIGRQGIHTIRVSPSDG